jgi:dihydrofolate reductase
MDDNSGLTPPFHFAHMTPRPSPSPVTLIVAIDAQRGIGIDNTLPWRLPEDLAHFKRLTSGHAIIMGRKTFDSIGRPLPNRRNIVVTRNAEWRHDGVEAAGSLEAALALARAPAPAQGPESAPAAPVFIIGGAQIFAEALPLADKLEMTVIDRTFNCDTFFPALDAGVWTETAREAYHSDANGFDYAFLTYLKASS